MMDAVRKSERARELRERETPSERWLWERLRGRRLAGAKFRRQHPFGPYVLDFYCSEHRLAVELDGSYHGEPDARGYDTARTEFLQGALIRVLRFTNHHVLTNTDRVLATIAAAIEHGGPHPLPPSPPAWRGGTHTRDSA